MVEYQDVPSKFFCLTLPKISVGEISIVALISGTGKVWIRRGRLSRFSVEIFLSHSAKNFCRGIIYCCTDFRYRKSLERRGEYQDAPSKISCLTMPKVSVGESSIVSLISGTEKVWKGGGGVSRFSVENFLSHMAEKFRRRIFYCCINLRYRKLWIKGGMGIKIFCQKVFVSQCRIFPEGNPLLLL